MSRGDRAIRHRNAHPGPPAVLPGRANPIPTSDRHAVRGTPIRPPFPRGIAAGLFGLGHFWDAERLFWDLSGIYTTAVGYAGGSTPNPTYDEVATGRTGHCQCVLVAFDPDVVTYPHLVTRFFEAHDPTQGSRQGDDVGPQYRSAIYGSEGQLAQARGIKTAYDPALAAEGFDPITTEIRSSPAFYFAEAEHQQYLARHPTTSAALAGTGVPCPIGMG